MVGFHFLNIMQKLCYIIQISIASLVLCLMSITIGYTVDFTKIVEIKINKNIEGEHIEFKATYADFDFELMGAHESDNPRLFEGPLVIKKKGGLSSLEIDLSLIHSLYGLEKSNCIIVHTFSGSENYFNVVDLTNGRQLHETIVAYSNKIDIGKFFLKIWPFCEEANLIEGDSCTAGHIYFFDRNNNYKPTLLEAESREFTKRIIGIEFEGTQNIIEPRTKNARIGLRFRPR